MEEFYIAYPFMKSLLYWPLAILLNLLVIVICFFLVYIIIEIIKVVIEDITGEKDK